jgi:hypothetical protein
MRAGKEEPIVLRSGASSIDLLSAFSNKVKETRLTAFLGYLIAQRADSILQLLGVSKIEIAEVSLEKNLKTQRVDIFISCDKRVIVIEAKVAYGNPIAQLKKQKKEVNSEFPIELVGITNNRFLKAKGIKIITWQDIYNVLPATNSNKIRVFSEDFKLTLENRGLAMPQQHYDIYARDLGHKQAATNFLKANIYFCHYFENSKIEKCRYFAPHFSQNLSKQTLAAQTGISHLAEIDSVEFVEDRKTFNKIVLSHIKKNKLKRYHVEIEAFIKSQPIKLEKPLLLMLLKKPHLVFNPPIHKNNLQEGSGWLSKKYYTFEDFFQAAKL